MFSFMYTNVHAHCPVSLHIDYDAKWVAFLHSCDARKAVCCDMTHATEGAAVPCQMQGMKLAWWVTSSASQTACDLIAMMSLHASSAFLGISAQDCNPWLQLMSLTCLGPAIKAYSEVSKKGQY